MFIKFEENDITLVDPIIKLLKIIDSYIKTNNIKNINTMRKKDFIIIFIIFFSIFFTLFFTFLFKSFFVCILSLVTWYVYIVLVSYKFYSM